MVLGDIQDEAGEGMAAALGGASRAIFRHCNVTNEAEVEALVEAAIAEFGQIDIMFNCAGIVGALGPMSTTPAEEWKLTIDIMINGVFYGMKHASRYMKEAGSGSIISMSSTAGVMGGLGPHAYAAAKHAVVGLTKNVAAELCGKGIRVNAIAAAAMATPMVAASFFGDPSKVDESIEQLVEMSPLKDVAPLNIAVISVTLETSHFERSPLNDFA